MPTVPFTRERQVTTRPLPGARLSSAAPSGAFDVPSVDLSGALREFAQIAQDERLKADQISVTGFKAKLAELETQLLHDPERGALNQRGEAAFTTPESTREAWDKATAEIAAGLTNPRQKLAFQQTRTERWTSINNSLQQHVSSESKRFDDVTTEEGLKAEREAAVRGFQDPQRVGAGIEQQQIMVVGYAKRNGLPADWIENHMLDVASKTHAGVLELMMAKGMDRLAQSYYTANKAELTSDDDEKISSRLEVATTDGAAIRAVDAVWTTQGPKTVNDPVKLATMETTLREQLKDDPKVYKAALSEMRTRAQAFNAEQTEIAATNKATVLGAYNSGATLAQVKRMPAYRSLSGTEQEQVASYIVDRGYALQQRHEANLTKSGFSTYWLLAQPDLVSRSDNEILALQSVIGRDLTGDLMRQKRALQGSEIKVREAAADIDMLKHHLRAANIDPENKLHSAVVGELRYQTENAIDQAQQARGKTLTRDEKEVLIKQIVDQRVKIDRWGNDTEKFAFMVGTNEQGKAYVPLTTIQTQNPKAITEYINFYRSNNLVLESNATNARIIQLFSGRIERAYGARLVGASTADITAILRGQK